MVKIGVSGIHVERCDTEFSERLCCRASQPGIANWIAHYAYGAESVREDIAVRDKRSWQPFFRTVDIGIHVRRVNDPVVRRLLEFHLNETEVRHRE